MRHEIARHGPLLAMTLAAACFSAGAAHGQTYPTKPVRIVTSPAGGGNDFPARLIARALAAPLGQQLIVDNRPTVLIADIVAKAPPDGHTLLVTGSAHWIGPLVEKVTYDPIRDFAPITLIDRAPSVLVVHPSMPVKNGEAARRAREGAARASSTSRSAGRARPTTSRAIMFNHMAGVNVVRIPYKGTGPALTAVMTGEVHAMFGSAGGAAPLVKVGPAARARGRQRTAFAARARRADARSLGPAGLHLRSAARAVRAGRDAAGDRLAAQPGSDALSPVARDEGHLPQGRHRGRAGHAGGADGDR